MTGCYRLRQTAEDWYSWVQVQLLTTKYSKNTKAIYLEPIPEPMSRTALAAVECRKTVASAKTAHLQSRYWDRFLVLFRVLRVFRG